MKAKHKKNANLQMQLLGKNVHPDTCEQGKAFAGRSQHFPKYTRTLLSNFLAANHNRTEHKKNSASKNKIKYFKKKKKNRET